MYGLISKTGLSYLKNRTRDVIQHSMKGASVAGVQPHKVTLCQMRTTDSIDDTFASIEGFAKHAVSDGSSMMFLPENAVFMGTSRDASLAIAENLDDQSDSTKLGRLKDICKRYAIWMSVGGFQETAVTDERGATKKLSNSHLILDDQGQVVTVYRKIHLFDLEYTPEDGDDSKKIQLNESLFTEPGQGLVACDSPVGRLGLSVCFDVRFPELYQILRYDMGAEVILIPAAFTVPTGEAHWEILLRARAIETQSFVIASAQSGRHHSKRESYGHSMVIDPWGRVLARIDDTDSGCVTVPLDLESLKNVRMRIPMEASREQGRQRYLIPRTIRVALFWYGFEHMAIAFQSAKTCQLAGFSRIRNTSTTMRALKKYDMDDVIRRKDVVSSFIRKRQSEDSNWEYLLVQRSPSVSTYQYPHWGAVSGGVERDDKNLVSRALQEIQEEVGYIREDVEYVCAGRPLYVDDNDQHFKVHPFLFTLQPTDKPVILNWENVDARFFSEEALAKVTPMVPLLLETLDTLRMDPEQCHRYRVVLEDRAHGAAELCLVALDQLRDNAFSLRCRTTEEIKTRVQNFGYMLATCRPNMAPVGNAIASVLRTWISRASDSDSMADALDVLANLIEKKREEMVGINSRVVARAIAHIGGIAKGRATMFLVTLSFSSSIRDTIRGLILEHPLVGFHVFVCESRPLFEGVNLGLEFLGSANTRVHIVTEAQMTSIFTQYDIDAVVVGADSLFETSFVNKVGTMQLVLAAQYYKVPHVIVIADVSKATTLEKFESEEKSTEEVTRAWVQGNILQEDALSQFSIPNCYFEETPLDLVTDVISGEGRISPDDIKTYIDDLRESYIVAFR